MIIPALLLGLTGSLHCVGMCGPLSLSLPSGNSASGRYVNSLCYNAGRICTYMIVGIVAGVIGRSFLLMGYQQILSILAGIIILVAAVGYYTGKRSKPFSFLNGFYKMISRVMFRLISKAHRPGGAFVFGMLNGLLPCGMVYIAAATSLSYGHVVYSGLFMLFFGMGTLPAMLLVVVAGHRIAGRSYRWLNRFTPVIITGIGLLLLIRGLNWDIPYLSPALNRITEGLLSCHS